MTYLVVGGGSWYCYHRNQLSLI